MSGPVSLNMESQDGEYFIPVTICSLTPSWEKLVTCFYSNSYMTKDTTRGLFHKAVQDLSKHVKTLYDASVLVLAIEIWTLLT